MSDLEARIRALPSDKRQVLLRELARRRQDHSAAGGPAGPAEPGPGPRPSGRTRFPLSPAQERIWLAEQVNPAAGYLIPLVFDLRGPLDKDLLRGALQGLVDRHESLRCSFHMDEDGPYQVVHHSVPLQWEYHDGSAEPAPAQWGGALITEAAARTLDLAAPPLLQATLARLGDGHHLACINVHHIACDGLSLDLLRRDLIELYVGGLHRREPRLPKLTVQFPDVADWQHAAVLAGTHNQHLDYWADRLRGLAPTVDLPGARADTARPGARGGRVFGVLGPPQVRALRDLGTEHRASLFMTALAAFKALTARMSNARDVAVGTSVAQRSRPELAELIGPLVNTVVLRDAVSPRRPFTELLATVRATVLEAYQHQALPFSVLEEHMKPGRPGGAPLVRIMFDLEPQTPSAMSLDGLTITPVFLAQVPARFDLSVELRPVDDGLRIDIEYNAGLFDADGAEALLNRYLVILDDVGRHPARPVAELDVFLAGERARLTGRWSGFDVADDGVPAQVIFERQADRTPDAPAISCDGRTDTYQQVDERASALAHELIARGVGAERIVALALDRGIDYLVAMLAVLKAGGAFLPVDPADPAERTRGMLDEASAVLILTGQAGDPRLTALTADRAQLSVPAFTGRTTARPQVPVAPRQLAYMIYTSGTTGRPKGVMIEHRGLANHLWAKVEDLGLTAADVVGQIAGATFDVSIWQYLAPLAVGGRTAVVTGTRAWDPGPLLDAMRKEGITVLESVPSHGDLILGELASGSRRPPASLRCYISNGEPLTARQVGGWRTLAQVRDVVNAYGLTEISDDSSHAHVADGALSGDVHMPIGGPLRNLRTYILDPDLRPVPVGAMGEICIGGIGMGRGYLGDPRKTAAAFVPDPFSAEPGSRLYRTGDVARYRADGLIEFIGRRDRQVKIRGVRVEAGEIEAVLMDHPAIRAAVVVAVERAAGDGTLVAYVVPSRYPAPSAADLRRRCARFLPDPMVPRSFVVIDELSLNDNGKIDRSRLPAPEDATPAREYTAPCNSVEARICAVWAAVLGADNVGATDSFFDLGGHSLAAVRAASALRSALGREVPLRLVFECPTPAKLAASLEGSAAFSGSLPDSMPGEPGGMPGEPDGMPGEPDGAAREPDRDDYPLAPNQVAEWFAYQLDPSSPAYNISFAEIFFTELDIDRFVATWQAVIDRHDVFRLTFGMRDGQPVQRLGPPVVLRRAELEIDRSQLTGMAITAEAARLAARFGQEPFDLRNGPVFRLGLARYGDGRTQLLFAVHHIVWDESSTVCLIREITEIYNAATEDREPDLPALPVRYVDHAVRTQRALAAGTYEADHQYWLGILHDPPAALSLPTDFPRPPVQTFGGRTAVSWLPRDLVRSGRAFCREHNVTLFTLVLAALDTYLYRITGQTDLVVGCPVAGRGEAAVEPLLGLFAAPMPIRAEIDPDLDFAGLLEHVRRHAADALQHSAYPASQVIEELSLGKDLSRPRLFSVMYGLQNNKTELLERAALAGSAVTTEDLYNAEAYGARFDLTFVLDEVGSDISLNCIYNVDLFRPETAGRILGGLLVLLRAAVAASDTPLRQLPLLDAAERRRLLGSQAAERPVPETTITDLFTAQAERTPQLPAILGDGPAITYAELREQHQYAAAHLASRGVQAGMSVAVMAEPCGAAVAAILGILRAGAAYVPVDPGTPGGRLRRIATLCELRLLVAGDQAGSAPCEVLTMASILSPTEGGGPASAAAPGSHAYTLFTSGTTGEPLGIPITHAAVADLLTATQEAYALSEKDRVALLSALVFDASVIELFWPLMTGAALVLPPRRRHRDPAAILAMLSEHRVTVIQCVPAQLEALVDAVERGAGHAPASLRLIICGGSYLSRELAERARTVLGTRLVNHYGPTEVCVDAATFDCDHPFDGDMVPIGRPIPNTRLYVLDDNDEPVPTGVSGAIYLASPRLTSGYLGQAVATSARFRTVDFGCGRGPERLFRTGDVGKVDHHGNVVFQGRSDRQVKVRGVRIEPAEIELAAAGHPLAGRCVAVPQRGRHGHANSLAIVVEPPADTNRVVADGETFTVLTLEQRPDLAQAANETHVRTWPPYFDGDAELARHWPHLNRTFPAYQLCLLAADGSLAAVGNTVPASWDGDASTLPAGWSAAMAEAFALHDCEREPDTLLMLTVIVTQAHQRRGLSAVMLRCCQALARTRGLARMAVVVRPSAKAEHPDVDFGAWCARRAPSGEMADPWLRAHERVGGTILHAVRSSQHIEGSLDDWARWTGVRPSADGPQVLPGTLQPATVDLATGTVDYDEPGVWVEHRPGAEDIRLTLLPPADLRRHLAKRLPGYMVPDRCHIVPALPRLPSGKLAELDLTLPWLGEDRPIVQPVTSIQAELVRLWQKVLGVQQVSVDDDFFLLEGQSLKALEMLSAVERSLGVHVPLRRFYDDTTILGLEQIIAYLPGETQAEGKTG